MDDESIYESVYRAVSNERKMKTDRLRFRKDRNLSLGAEYLLISACRELGLDYHGEVAVCSEGKKKTYRAGNLYYNLSHSGQRAMCAVSCFPVGCDTELISVPDMEIAARYFSPEENKLIDDNGSEENRIELFYRLWTLKESYVKCSGLGLSLPFSSFSVCLSNDAPACLNTADGSEYAFFEYFFNDGYRYSCCVNNAAMVREDINESFQWKRIGTDS